MDSLSKDNLQALLDELRSKHGVVGATVGVLRNGSIEAAGSGLLNLDTGVECTADSVFQIGSIGKVFTTTLMMQLVDEGRLSLDDLVVKHLPNFTLADMAAARTTTIRQLLNHTSGMDGDFFPGDDPEGPSTESYVRKMWLLPNLYAPGDGPVTYCNSGFVTAGRIIEVLTGMTWQTAVLERICKPLKLSHVVAYPHEGLRYRCAMGHIADPKDPAKTRTAPATFLALSAAAAGSVLSMSTESVLKFVGVHMADGAYGDGKTLLSAKAAHRMREDITPLPAFSRGGITHWGLGWFGCSGHGYEMVGHDGGTFGQFTYLRAFPEKGIAFAVFTNSPSGKFYEELEDRLMQALVGVSIPALPAREDWSPKLERFVGRYRNVGADYDIVAKGDALTLRVASKLGMPPFEATMEPYREDVFALSAPDTPADGQKALFLDNDDSGRAVFFRVGTRMGRRV